MHLFIAVLYEIVEELFLDTPPYCAGGIVFFPQLPAVPAIVVLQSYHLFSENRQSTVDKIPDFKSEGRGFEPWLW